MELEVSERKKGRPSVRWAVRFAACAAAAACAWPWDGWPAWLSGAVPSLSPFAALLAAAAGAGSLWLLGALAVAAASALSPRLFCRWLCPLGTCQDALTCRMGRRAWLGRVPQLGLWLVLLGLGTALAGYPLFGWLDPLAIFNAAFGAARGHLTRADWVAAAGLPLVLLLALAAPGLWCGRLCPLGALQDLLRFPLRRAATPEAREKEAVSLGRRAFLGLGLGAGYRLVLRPSREPAAPVIRPPVTGASSRFTRLCVRCGACVRACPSGVIRFGGSGAGWAGVLAPEVRFDSDYCSASCTACGRACPVGAIPKFTVEQKAAAPMGLAVVDHETCLLNAGRECGACAAACPHEALDVAWDKKALASRVAVKSRACTGCGYCEYVCPSDPRSIRVVPLSSVRATGRRR